MTDATIATRDNAATFEIVECSNDSLERVRSHPFIQRAHAAQLTRDQALRWIKCAGRESRSFPDILRNMIPFSCTPAIARVLEDNLDDELGGGNPEHAHFKHYLHLLDDLGVRHADFYEYKEGAGISFALNVAYNVSKSAKIGVALGYMVVNESMTPITYRAARAALTKFYPAMKTTFFDMHIAVDDHHVEELWRAIEDLGQEELDAVKFGILLGERGMAALLDEALGFFDYLPEGLPVYERQRDPA